MGLLKRLYKLCHPDVAEENIHSTKGVDSYWLENIRGGAKNFSHQLIYVGRFDVNKNEVRLIHAAIGLKELFPDIKLPSVVGPKIMERPITGRGIGGDCFFRGGWRLFA